ncbi:MAG: DUF3108 domain-containing protein [Rhodanobacteraceae bacterium]
MKSVIALIGMLAAVSPSALYAATPQAFTAHYQVLKKGEAIGEATMQLRARDSDWLFTTRTRGEHGLAGLLGMTTDESSLFRWRDGHVEMISYDYRLDAGIKQRHRTVQADWQKRRVQVQADGRNYDYPAVPAVIERHLLSLTLGQELEKGSRSIALPVAVKDRVEIQHFRLKDHDDIKVPAGRMQAQRVQRSDPGKNFTAWYATQRYPVPAKMEYGDYTLLLKTYSSP